MFSDNANEMHESEYKMELFKILRKFYELPTVLDIAEGDVSVRDGPDGVVHPGESQLSNMESVALDLLELHAANRPPTASISHFETCLKDRLRKVPERLAAGILRSELDLWRGSFGVNEDELLAEITVFEVAEEILDTDYSDSIAKAAEELPESETKLDLLEERGMIDGDEWYDRTTQLRGDATAD